MSRKIVVRITCLEPTVDGGECGRYAIARQRRSTAADGNTWYPVCSRHARGNRTHCRPLGQPFMLYCLKHQEHHAFVHINIEALIYGLQIAMEDATTLHDVDFTPEELQLLMAKVCPKEQLQQLEEDPTYQPHIRTMIRARLNSISDA